MFAALDRSPGRLLVVDDDDDHRESLAELLRREGYSVVEAHDGAEALRTLESAPPGYFQAVVCDQRMPGFDGTECVERAASRARFILFTGAEERSISRLAQRAGAAAFLRKPVDPNALSVVVALIAGDEPAPPPSGIES